MAIDERKRINMAFTPGNYRFIQQFSKLKGQTMTDFVNDVVHEYIKQHEAVITDRWLEVAPREEILTVLIELIKRLPDDGIRNILRGYFVEGEQHDTL